MSDGESRFERGDTPGIAPEQITAAEQRLQQIVAPEQGLESDKVEDDNDSVNLRREVNRKKIISDEDKYSAEQRLKKL